MRTKKQDELVASFLSMLDDDIRQLYDDVLMHLSRLGYGPIRDRSNISLKHHLHNKQIAKVGVRKGKEHSPFIALRFSACRGYTARIEGVVVDYITKYPTRSARCVNDGCNYCSGEAITHVYTFISPDGEKKMHCGAYAVEIPNITWDDLGEIKKLIDEEHAYLMRHEAGVL